MTSFSISIGETVPQIEALNIDNKLLTPLHIPREKTLTFMRTEQVKEADIGLSVVVEVLLT